jgi:hypothetical protein
MNAPEMYDFMFTVGTWNMRYSDTTTLYYWDGGEGEVWGSFIFNMVFYCKLSEGLKVIIYPQP